ncbi:MAG: hypothetical protein JWN86_10 [Planctomycetota bacterium]|nr:hypothetical protein [Planctomycetota bacterium]
MTILLAFNLGLGDGRRLVLAGITHWGFWLAAGLVALGLILVLYRYERKLVSRTTGLTLLAMRVLAALALVAALFEPIAARTFRETVRGRVILGVDLSESMATADADRSAGDRARLAKTLGASPTEPIANISRREVARRLIAGEWIKPIVGAHDVEAIGFARESAGDGSVAAIANRLKSPGKPDDPASLATDWTPVLERGLKDSAQPIVGVVLLTDGRQNGGDGANSVADKLAARGVHVYPVLIGSTNRPRDAAIAAVKSPERVSKGDMADIEVTIKLDGPAAGTEVPVTLDRPGASPMKKLVRVPADGSRPVVAFRVPMDSAGVQTLTAAVGPIDGDVRADNDRRPISIEVADDRAKVLLIDGEARWEFQYLRNALVRDPHVTVDSLVFHQPAMTSGDPTYRTALPPRPDPSAKDRPPDPLGSYDVIILGDVGPEDLNAEAWTRLEWYVDVRGGTLVFSSGPRSFASMINNETARKLLPILDARAIAADAIKPDPLRPALPPGVAIAVSPSAASESFPMLRFAAEADKSREIWKGLPRQPWAATGKPKPLASVLATIADSTDEAGALIAAQPYGLGKVMWIGTDGTWRWRYRVGDLYHHRFWGQVVRWANATKLAVGNRLVRYGPTKPRVIEGVGATLRAQFADDAPGVGSDLLVAARLFKRGPDGKALGESVAIVPLRPRTDQARTFEAVAPPLSQGSYLIRLDVPQLGADSPRAEAPLEILARDTPERIELAASRDALDRLASATGGKVFADVDADALPALLKSTTIERERTEETSLWDRPWALLLFFGVLTVEWVLRKRAGLP